jgi:hypothetical protein
MFKSAVFLAVDEEAGWRGAKVSKEKEAGLRRIPLQPAVSL